MLEVFDDMVEQKKKEDKQSEKEKDKMVTVQTEGVKIEEDHIPQTVSQDDGSR